MKKSFCLFSLALGIFLISACQQNKEQPPNIIFILTDDLGYGDLGVTFQNQRAEEGKPHHKTPHLDRMAGEGMLLTRHYVGAPVCAPSRASLLTGMHQGHADIRDNQFDKALPDNHNLATVLKKAGYRTGLIGKWGLQGLEGDSPETWEAYPTKRGFDHFFGYVRHRDGHNHYPAHEVRARPVVELYSGEEEISDRLRGAYTTDLFTAAAKKWITEQNENQPEQPFFLYLAYDTPHAGLEVAPSPYPEGGGLEGGVQWIGEEGRFINTVSDTIDSYIHPDYAGQDWPEPQKRFASMVRRIDNAVGDLLQLLQDLNLNENTMIVFTSDNGPHRESYGYGQYNPTLFESFGPMDGVKRDNWEGGIRVPAIVHWPGKVAENTTADTPSGFHDWLPTFADLTGLPSPASSDGSSLMPLFAGNEDEYDGQVYIEYNQNGRTPGYEAFDETHRDRRRGQMQVLYLDGYKGVRYDVQSADDDFHIYDTQNDPGETRDLAGSDERFKELQQRMKDRVLRLRRPNESAPRPYDDAPVPALRTINDPEPGLRFKVFEMSAPWVPDVAALQRSPDATGTASGFDLGEAGERQAFVAEFSGLLEVPQAGAYTFSLQTGSKAVMRIHDALLIDADREYESGSTESGVIHLEQGLHPIQLTVVSDEAETPQLQLQWSGPDLALQSIQPARLSH